MKDPCKSERCISYPVCISKGQITCPIFLKYILEHINNNIISYKKVNERPHTKFTDVERDLIWNAIDRIFPNLQVLQAHYILNDDRIVDMEYGKCTEPGMLNMIYVTRPSDEGPLYG